MLAAPPFNFQDTLDKVDTAIDANANIADSIVDYTLPHYGFDRESDPWKDTATPNDLDKARSTIKQFFRDWSIEGATERNACYGSVLKAVDEIFAGKDRGFVNVLVPGAGLGRLVFEFFQRGYTVEGNEISYHQLMASNWILNHTSTDKPNPLYPFALEFSNVVSRTHQLKQVSIPDVDASTVQEPHEHSTVPASERMSMTASDFIFLYSDKNRREKYDVVATVFFLDTAPNVIRYMETVHNCLKNGGIWVNLGPLLWHFSDRGPKDMSSSEEEETESAENETDWKGIEEPGSIELSNEEVLMLLGKMGFEIMRYDMPGATGYIQNPESLLQNLYRVTFWVARKKAGP